MKHKLFFLFSLLILSHYTYAQVPADCATALPITSFEETYYYYDSLRGSLVEDFVTSDCSLIPNYQEKETVWLKYKFNKGGNFKFIIIPKNKIDDIDFMLYEADNNNCSKLNIIRCMVAGETIGIDSSGVLSRCLGPTGLSDEDSDVVEFPGCRDINNGFLKSVEVDTSKTYYLAIVNYSANPNFTIRYYGTAIDRDCETLKSEISLVQENDYLKVNKEGFKYSWINCDNLELISNESFVYKPTYSGNFAVSISDKNCNVMSDCVNYTLNIINDEIMSNVISLYPNPSKVNETISISTKAKVNINYIEVIDMFGRTSYFNNSNKLVITNSGLHLVRINTESGVILKKILVD